MSVQDQIDRISGNVAATYGVLESAGATVPASQNSDNLAATVEAALTDLGGAKTFSVAWVLQASVDLNSVSSYVCQWDGLCKMEFRSNWGGAGYGFVQSSEGSMLGAETWTTNTYMYDMCPCVKGETWTRHSSWSNVESCVLTFYELQITAA